MSSTSTSARARRATRPPGTHGAPRSSTGSRPNPIPVHTPIHASRLNQAEIYFSVVQHKLVTPNDFEQIAAPFQSNYTRDDLNKPLTKTDTTAPASAAA